MDLVKLDLSRLKESNPLVGLNESSYIQFGRKTSVPFDFKLFLEDDVHRDGTFVSTGSQVTYHPYEMGRMESVWGSDCREFKPDRWLGSDGVFRLESAFKYPVFHGGHRVCLSKELAIMKMKAVVVDVVRESDIDIISRDHDHGAFVVDSVDASRVLMLPRQSLFSNRRCPSREQIS